MLDIFAFISQICITSFIPFIYKELSHNISALNFSLIRWIMGGITGLVIFFIFYKDAAPILDLKANFYLFIFLLDIFLFIGSYIYIYLLKTYDANMITLIIQPLTVFTSAIIATLFYGDVFTPQMILGTFITICGLVIFIQGKK